MKRALKNLKKCWVTSKSTNKVIHVWGTAPWVWGGLKQPCLTLHSSSPNSVSSEYSMLKQKFTFFIIFISKISKNKKIKKLGFSWKYCMPYESQFWGKGFQKKIFFYIDLIYHLCLSVYSNLCVTSCVQLSPQDSSRETALVNGLSTKGRVRGTKMASIPHSCLLIVNHDHVKDHKIGSSAVGYLFM